MAPFRDLGGQQFGYLLAMTRAPNRGDQKRAQWLCECACGKTIIVRMDALVDGRTRSCGCQTIALRIVKLIKHGHSPGSGVKSPEYSHWSSMIQRCTNPKSPGYKDYGGRGIQICEEWHHSFPAYLAYRQVNLGPRPSPQHSIDRIDNNGNYEPGNLRWATRVEQIHNRRYGPGRKKGAKDNGRRSVRPRVQDD